MWCTILEHLEIPEEESDWFIIWYVLAFLLIEST